MNENLAIKNLSKFRAKFVVQNSNLDTRKEIQNPNELTTDN